MHYLTVIEINSKWWLVFNTLNGSTVFDFEFYQTYRQTKIEACKACFFSVCFVTTIEMSMFWCKILLKFAILNGYLNCFHFRIRLIWKNLENYITVRFLFFSFFGPFFINMYSFMYLVFCCQLSHLCTNSFILLLMFTL